MAINPSGAIGKRGVEKWSDILFWSCLTAMTGLAIFFRSQGYFNGNINFWWDEANWAHKLLTKPLIEVIKIRSVGFMLLTKFLVNTFSRDETVFRLIPYLSSILALPLVFLIARRIWDSKVVILLIVFLAAFNPDLITFAKEFKPYAFNFFVHCCLIFFALSYIDSKKTNVLYALLAISAVSVFFSYNIVFVFPAIFIIIMLQAYAEKNYIKFTIIISTVLVIFLSLFLMYKFIWSAMDLSREETYWGNKYDVFFVGSGLVEHCKWLAAKYVGLVKDSSMAQVFWPWVAGSASVAGPLLLFFHAVGILGFYLEKKLDYLILFLFPILTVMVANSLGIWPFGPFRVDLFLMIYFLILTCNGFYYFITRNNRTIRYGMYGIIGAFFFVLQLPVNFHYYNIKPENTWVPAQSDVLKALDAIVGYEKALRSKGYASYGTIAVLADNHAYFSTQYYLTDHPQANYYAKVLGDLNVKYHYVLSGVEAGNYSGAETLVKMLTDLSKKPGIFRGETWIVLGNPRAIEKIEPIIDKIPERIIYRKKFSYANLVVFLRT